MAIFALFGILYCLQAFPDRSGEKRLGYIYIDLNCNVSDAEHGKIISGAAIQGQSSFFPRFGDLNLRCANARSSVPVTEAWSPALWADF
jgi:hypothetical protein